MRVFYLQLLSVTAGKDLVQEPFLAEGGAPALLHAMYVAVIIIFVAVITSTISH